MTGTLLLLVLLPYPHSVFHKFLLFNMGKRIITCVDGDLVKCDEVS